MLIATDVQVSFLERLSTPTPIVTDGSIAAELAERGLTEFPPCLYTIKQSVLIEDIHRAFLDAGAELLQSNTEHANRLTLERYGLADKVYELNRTGVWIARYAAQRRAFVAGVVGPVGKFLAPLGPLSTNDVRDAFIQQITALADGGADVLMLKSFIDIAELELAIDAAMLVAPNLPIIAQKTFPEDGAVLATAFPTSIAQRLAAKGVTVIGTNGTVGPQRMLDILKHFRIDGIPLCSQPDVGIPTLVDGKAIFNAEPHYVAQAVKRLVEVGAHIVGCEGGCTVAHTRAIVEAVQTIPVGNQQTTIKPSVRHEQLSTTSTPTKFFQNIGKKLLATVELDVPRGLDISSILEGAAYLKEQGIDAVNISDGARARLRMSSIAISHIVQQQVGIECITHLACRDRNMIGLQSELLGAHALGVRNILAVTGDPTQIGDFPYATSVYDVDSIGLIRALGQMNQGKDLMGNPIGGATQFCIACACNPSAYDLDREVERLEHKAAQGAHVVFSQPVFDTKTLERFLERIRHIRIALMLGVIPLRSARHADFLHHEVPGMYIPEWVRHRIHRAQDKGGVECATQEGINLAVEFLRTAQHMVQGIYLMPPFKKYSMAVDILRQL
ncbi:MAG: bifunctional homocysteine S-methyltransferase/methylenetetrahydrofolate reductase [Bacteroidota bacterium]|nr:bifunctional homocysteine S-methyltransferase/methylenetetrahydrofolate reductase [Candidatus Kapabacteria bacterium]MDW8221046.1 bifunctional homocysteine S-methyltransferase/methylenetetrahydrofolate reductase [Bacteroidota bacterium]